METDRFCECVANGTWRIQPHEVMAPPNSDTLLLTSEQTTTRGRRTVVHGTRPISRPIDLTAHSGPTATACCPTNPSNYNAQSVDNSAPSSHVTHHAKPSMYRILESRLRYWTGSSRFSTTSQDISAHNQRTRTSHDFIIAMSKPTTKEQWYTNKCTSTFSTTTGRRPIKPTHSHCVFLTWLCKRDLVETLRTSITFTDCCNKWNTAAFY